MRKLVCGYGLNDVIRENYPITLYRRAYKLWASMLNRVYKRTPYTTHYCGCFIAQRWLSFSNFLTDIQTLPGFTLWYENPHKRIALDKDILGTQHKCYSPAYCMFVTSAENNREKNLRHKSIPSKSVEARRKISEALSQPLIATKDNIEYFYPSVIKCAKDIGGDERNISACLCGKRKSHMGFSFRRVTA